MKLISEHKRSKVYYNNREGIYIKTFQPKMRNRLKYLMKLRKSPGRNFQYISETLKSLGIYTPEVVEAADYFVSTREVRGVLLEDYIVSNPEVVGEFLDTLILILKNNIHCGDFNLGNFMVSKGKLYVMDLEDYRKVRLFPRKLDRTIERLRHTLGREDWAGYVAEGIERIKAG